MESKENIRSFMARRRKEILIQIKELKNELRELKVVEKTLHPVTSTSDSGGGVQIAPGQPRRPTFQDMTISVLCKMTGGANAQSILELIARDFGKRIERSSLSPQLSRLKDRGILQLNNGIWSLTQSHLPKNETPTVAPVGASSGSDNTSDLV